VSGGEAPALRVLVVDDDPMMTGIMEKHLRRLGYEADVAHGGAEALAKIDSGLRPDVLVSDVRMPGMDGRALMAEARRRLPELRVILMTAFGAVSDAVEAMREGAYWYLTKPFKVEEAAVILARAASEMALTRRVEQLERRLRRDAGPERFLGRSPAAVRVRSELALASSARTSVLLTGRTGTGKELAARIIHAGSSRAGEGFVPVNCSAIPEALFESELFGHRRGAFTGALEDAPGLAEAADGGTLFLDEVGDLPASQQPKLLRLLEEGELRRVGDRTTRKVDVRVIAATNRPLATMLGGGTFRDDLYYRLSALIIDLPELAERPEDIPEIAEALAVEAARVAGVRPRPFTPRAIVRLTQYRWPGNVRELRNVVERALLRARDVAIDEEDLVFHSPANGVVEMAARVTEEIAPLPSIDDVERDHIARVLVETGWNRSRAAAILGIDRRTLFTKVARYGLVAPKSRRDRSV